MQGGFLTYALLAALATALLIAAITDLRRRQIDNWLNAGIALLAPVYWLASGLGWIEIAFQLGLAIVVFLIGAALFAARQMGGGDVKLLTALALWIVPVSFAKLFVMMAMIGGAMSLAAAAFNMRRGGGETIRTVLAATAATVLVGFCAGAVYTMSTGRPAVPDAVRDTVSAALPEGVAFWVLGGAVIAALLLGVWHLVRRQRAPLRIPYGVAISAAGLWILVNQHFNAISPGGAFG